MPKAHLCACTWENTGEWGNISPALALLSLSPLSLAQGHQELPSTHPTVPWPPAPQECWALDPVGPTEQEGEGTAGSEPPEAGPNPAANCQDLPWEERAQIHAMHPCPLVGGSSEGTLRCHAVLPTPSSPSSP